MSQTIFVLEDDADISRLVQYHLEGAGFTVKIYPAIGSIVSDAERQPPSLFLLDIMVPGGDGLDLCRRLRQNPSVSVVPIIFLTARAAENDRVPRPRAWRRRLHHQALRHTRAGRPGQSRAAPLRASQLALDRPLRRDRDRRQRHATARQRRPSSPPTATEFRLPRLPGPASQPRLQPRPAAGPRSGVTPRFVHAALGRRVCPPHSRKDRRRCGDAALPEDHARSRLSLRDPEESAALECEPARERGRIIV